MDNELPAPNPPATNNVEAYLAMLAGVQDLPMPATINNNVEYYLRYLVEHGGGGGGGIPTDVVDAIWFGTQAQYDAISPKANKTLYLIKESVTTNNLSATLNSQMRPGLTTTQVSLGSEETLSMGKKGLDDTRDLPEESLDTKLEDESEELEEVEEEITEESEE